MIAHTFNPSAWEAEEGRSEFEARLVNMVNSRIARNIYHFKGKKNGLHIYMSVIYTIAYKLYTYLNTHRPKNSRNRVHVDFNSSYLVNKTEIYRQTGN